MITADWVAVDWGTSCLRAWAMSEDGRVLAQRANEQGMGKLSAADYEQQFLTLAGDWLMADEPTEILVCGMAGSREGWQEAAYLPVPVRLPQQLAAVSVTTADPRLQVAILPGLKQLQPANVMRGEETQIAGFLGQQPDFSGVLVLPGTHTKWVRIQQQQVQEFTTAMTGELFKLISEQSILCHSVSHEYWQQAVFDDHFISALQNPAGLSQRLFGLRASGLLQNQSGDTAFAKLSADLIALEIAGVQNNLLSGNDTSIAVIGNNRLAALYQRALELAERPAQAYSGAELALAGLIAAYQSGP